MKNWQNSVKVFAIAACALLSFFYISISTSKSKSTSKPQSVDKFETQGMRFTFEGKNYIASMNAIELYGDGRFGSDGHNLPIKLPDGRFIQVAGWMESYPPRASKLVEIEDNGRKKYATAKLTIN